MIQAYIRIVRPVNVVMTACGVCLGFWLSGSPSPLVNLVFLACAGSLAVGFGNTVNDLCDRKGDEANHPGRPLPKGEITPRAARAYSVCLLVAALACGFHVSVVHGIATAIPLLLLAAYALLFKGTPLAGNIIISLLVAYPLLYGGLAAPGQNRLFVPAVLAFLLNLGREIVKDIQDKPGDTASGARTTAALPFGVLRAILLSVSLIYLCLMPLPFALGHFMSVYLGLCLILVLPLHALWTRHLLARDLEPKCGRIASMIKLEMLLGLTALAADHLLLGPPA